MKNRVAFGLVLALAMISLASAHAQTFDMLRAQIPFEFVVGEVTLPAGTYLFGTPSTDAGLIVIRNTVGEPCILTMTNRVQGPHMATKDVIRFARHGKKYFLRQVWTSNTDMGRQFSRSPLEKELLALGVGSAGMDIPARLQ